MTTTSPEVLSCMALSCSEVKELSQGAKRGEDVAYQKTLSHVFMCSLDSPDCWRKVTVCGRAFFSGLFPGDHPAVKSAQYHVHGSTHSAFLMQSCLTWSTWRAKQIPKYVDFKSTLTTFQSHIKIRCNLPCQDLSARPSHMVFITHSCKPGELCFISC